MGQITYLTSMLYNQLGLTEAVFDGTADEKTMLNYYNRTVNPILTAITDEMKRKFLTKTARSQGQSITYFSDPFRLVPVTELANIADKFTRNEVLSSNEVRGIIGFKPSADPKAEELRNKNLNNPNLLPDATAIDVPEEDIVDPEVTADDNTTVKVIADNATMVSVIGEQDQIMSELLDSLESDIDKQLAGGQNG